MGQGQDNSTTTGAGGADDIEEAQLRNTNLEESNKKAAKTGGDLKDMMSMLGASLGGFEKAD